MSKKTTSKNINRYISHQKKDLWQIYAKDIFVVSLTLYCIFSWFKWRNPEITIEQFHINFLLLACAASACYIFKEKIIPRINKKNVIYSVLLLFFFYQFKIQTATHFNTYNDAPASILNWETLLTLLFTIIFFVLLQSQKENLTTKPLSKRFYYFFLIFLVVWSSYLIFYKLGKNDFFHDEQWHVLVVESLKHGDGLHLWNFASNTMGAPYSRGIIVNVFAFLFGKLFGFSEFSLRFFPALAGLSIIPIIYYVFKNSLGKLAALITAMGFSFNLSALFLARFLRPYTLFLLSYLLSFYFYDKILEELFNKKRPSKFILYSLLLGLSMLICLQTNGLSRILFVIFPVHFFIVVISNKTYIKDFFNKNKKIVITSASIILVCFALLEIFKLSNIHSLVFQAHKHLSFSKILNPKDAYWDYLSIYYIKNYFIFKFLFIFGILSMLCQDRKSKRKKLSLFLMFGILPVIFLSFLLDRYDDIRYIYFAIPFVYGIMIYGLTYFMKLFFTRNTVLRNYAALFFSILFIFYPVLPVKEIPLFSKESPAIWSDTYTQKTIHRRMVAQEWKKVYDYINNEQSDGDVVVLQEGDFYLKPKNGVTYYTPPPPQRLGDGMSFYNSQNGDKINFEDLIKKPGKIYFINSYAHLLSKDVSNYLLLNCKNISEELGVKKYAYVGWYEEKNLFWPNLFLCEK